MKVDHKATLRNNMTFLQSNISVSRSILLDRLLECGVLDEQEVDEIRSKNTERDKVRELLDVLFRTSDVQYQHFLEALNAADHEHVYDKLKGI